MRRNTTAALFVGGAIGAASVVAFSQTAVTTTPAVAGPLPLAAVRLTGGPLKQAQDLNAKYLLELEPDRMLAFYRDRAALPKKAEP
ncbi:MAG: hypothetical protein H0W08_24465 [Acidobacteria bacterium]|nr:hypothetical protein [Acidobacteriota bacterium]